MADGIMSTSTPRLRRLAASAAFAALLFAGACGPAPPPPYHLAFSLDAASPRLLETSQEIAVPVALGNTGDRAWDPARIHLSYHWLWLVPRELAHRSRTVPYHDGIRTDLGDAPVAPGARVALQGRILAPAWPGVYWLQWDMVEEGVTWFAQVAPRQPRTLVVVVPPPAWIFAPLPLLVALWGLFGLRIADCGLRKAAQPFGPAIADVWWCAATLAAKPLILAHAALLEPTAVAYWLILAVAIVVPVLGLLILPRRVRPWVLLAIGIFCSLLILADVVYYRFFGDVLSTPAMLAAHQTGHVWGSVGSLFTPGLLWLLIDWPFAFWLVVRMSRRPAPVPRPAAAAGWRRPLRSPGWRRAPSPCPCRACSRPRRSIRCSARARSSSSSGRSATTRTTPGTTCAAPGCGVPRPPAQIDEALAWLRERAPLRAGGADFAAARGANLIVVQVESLQDFAVDFTVGGQEVMPHLRRWTGDSLRFTNVTDQTSEGRTSDAEFTTMTSLLPLDHGAVAFRFPGNHYAALPRVLTEHGYATLSAVAFEPGFWNRQVMHPAYGFQRSLFEPDFQMTGADRLGAERSRFPPADGAAARAAAAAVRRVADHAVAASSVRGVSRRAQGAEARRARGHVVRQLPAHDALLRSGARGLQGRAGARRAARRQRARRVRRSRRRLRARRVAGAHDRDRDRRRRVDAERSHSAVHQDGRGRRGQEGKARSSLVRAIVRRGRPTSRRRCSRCSASIRRRCRISAATCSAPPTIGRCRVRTATGSTRAICFSRAMPTHAATTSAAVSSARRLRAPRRMRWRAARATCRASS